MGQLTPTALKRATGGRDSISPYRLYRATVCLATMRGGHGNAATSNNPPSPPIVFVFTFLLGLIQSPTPGYECYLLGNQLSGAAACLCRNPPLPCFPVSQFPSISALSRPVRGGSRPRPLHEVETRLHIHAWLYRGHHTAHCVPIGSVVGTFESINADPMKAASGFAE